MSSQSSLNNRVAIVTGAGEKSFTTGADIKSFITAPKAMSEMWQTQADQLLNRGLEVWKPVIAAVNGPAAGGGNELVVACDIAIAGESAWLGQTGPRVGSSPILGGANMLAMAIGEKKAKEVWKWIEPFAAYGFNKAHAASYGKVAYQTAYMKANFPVDYMAAVLTADAGDVEKIAEIVAEWTRRPIFFT